MKIFVSHSTSYNFEEELYKPLRNSELNKKHEIILPHENGQHIETKDIIRECDLVVAEVSHPSTGQGIELGWADMYNVPILCISKKGAKVSRSLHYVTNHFIVYENAEDMIVQLENFVSSRTK